MIDYPRFIEENFTIIDKSLNTTPFILNKPQRRLSALLSGRSDILKARQEGFSSYITAMFTADFILLENSYSISVADVSDNAELLLQKVKHYISSYEETNGIKVPLKYNSKHELYNPFMNSRYQIGTAGNTQFGRSRTVSNLHLSEAAFYPDIEGILAGAGQAVIEDGRLIIETTANGFNEYKTHREHSRRGETGYNALFFPASEFYPADFLDKKRKELGRLFLQEYPETEQDAFIASGECYFSSDALHIYYKQCREPGVGVFEAVR